MRWQDGWHIVVGTRIGSRRWGMLARIKGLELGKRIASACTDMVTLRERGLALRWEKGSGKLRGAARKWREGGKLEGGGRVWQW